MLTTLEENIIKQLNVCLTKYGDMPEYNPGDRVEFSMMIHAAQDKIASRAFWREVRERSGEKQKE